MFDRSLGPGDDVDSWCTRCKMNLNHRIIAIVGNDIKRVECLTCGSQHNYRPPKSEVGHEKRSMRPKSDSSPTRGNSRKTSSTGAKGEWTTFMKEKPDDLIPRPYALSQNYQPGEYIEHPILGTGRVLEILGNEKIHVVFEEGRKILLCNRPVSR